MAAFELLVVVGDLDDLVAALAPRHITITGDFNVRGGIKTTIEASHLAR